MKTIFVLALFFSSLAYADDMKCVQKGLLNEPRPASLEVLCDGFSRSGYISDEQKVTQINLVLVMKNGEKQPITIKPPKLGVRAYLALTSNDAGRAKLTAMGIKPDDVTGIQLDSFSTPTTTNIYRNAGPLNSTDLSGTPMLSKTEKDAYAKCSWVTSAYVLFTSQPITCGGKRLCVGQANCDGKTITVSCMAVGPANNQCPTLATECANDRDVEFRKPGAEVLLPPKTLNEEDPVPGVTNGN